MRICVIAGGPSSGKTATIKVLKKRGFQVLEESAREILSSVEGDYEKLQKMIMFRQIRKERQLNVEGLVFLDRSVLDSIVYSDIFIGHLPDGIKKVVPPRKYFKVFMLERLPFESDGLRIESGNEQAQEIHDKLIRIYEEHGCELIHVPVMPIEERVGFILGKLED